MLPLLPLALAAPTAFADTPTVGSTPADPAADTPDTPRDTPPDTSGDTPPDTSGDTPPDTSDTSDVPQPAFGTDVSVGIGAAALLGAWPDPGVSGFAAGRVDLFMVDRDTPGPRFGASVWGRSSVWPLQTHTGTEEGATAVPFHVLQYGLAAVIRYDPSAPLTGTFGFGFGRADLDGYEGGVQAVPLFTVEAGLRQRVGRGFVDYGAQSGWGSARNTEGAWEEWWTVSVGLNVGFHVR
jgi:hypothetical protein